MKIGLIGAFDAEIEKFITLFNLKMVNKNNHHVLMGNYDGKEIIAARSGIGKVNAAMMTQYLIDTYQPDIIINSGCAGSLVEQLKIMNIVISSYVTYHDFKPARIMEYSVPNKAKVLADEHLIEIAENSLKSLHIDKFEYIVGPICSGDCFITDASQRDSIHKETFAYCVDMESGSIGHVCSVNEVPFICIRTISDFSDGAEDHEEAAAYLSSHIVKEMITQL